MLESPKPRHIVNWSVTSVENLYLGDSIHGLSTAVAAPPPQRNVAVDAYRGLVMLLMMGEVMDFYGGRAGLSRDSTLLAHPCRTTRAHVEWTGMGLHDMIQPSFTFLVGVALPYSLRSRQREGTRRFQKIIGHTIWRSILLMCLGFFLRSMHSPMTNFTFEDTLTQIGMGYTFAVLLTFLRPRWQWTAFGVILVGYWLAWALYPAPGPNFDWNAVGVPDDWHSHLLSMASPPTGTRTAISARPSTSGSSISSLGRPAASSSTMAATSPSASSPLSGPCSSALPQAAGSSRALAGHPHPQVPHRRVQSSSPQALLLLHFAGINPIVKRIWTPAWTLWSGGCLLSSFSPHSPGFVDVKKNTPHRHSLSSSLA